MQRIIMVVLAVLLAGCSSPKKDEVKLKVLGPAAVPQGYKTHEGPDQAFQISFPADWTVEPFSERMDARTATTIAGASIVGGAHRSSLVAKKKDGLAGFSPVARDLTRTLVSINRMALYDSEKYVQFKKEYFVAFLEGIEGKGAQPIESQVEIPVGRADVLEATWIRQGQDIKYRSTFIRDLDHVVYVIDVITATTPGQAAFETTPVIDSFRPGS